MCTKDLVTLPCLSHSHREARKDLTMNRRSRLSANVPPNSATSPLTGREPPETAASEFFSFSI